MRVVLGVGLLLIGAMLDATSARAQAGAFRALLAPHGTWITIAEHGEVFVPREASDDAFAPYVSGGRWEERDRGLVFQSVYAWGEVCFHQGRWLRTDETRSWVWVPGREWSSAWVEWRARGDEVAWRALGPDDGPADLRASASPWSVAPRSALGSPQLVAAALRVGGEALAAFRPARMRTLRDGASAPSAESPLPSARVGRGQVMVSGGGRIVVHGPDGDRVLTAEPVIVSRAEAEARAADQARRDEARRDAERVALEERARAAEAREREALAAAARAADAAERAEAAAARAATAPATDAPAPATIPIVPYGAFAYANRGAWWVGPGVPFDPYARRRAPSPPPVASPPPAAPAPRPAPLVGAVRREPIPVVTPSP